MNCTHERLDFAVSVARTGEFGTKEIVREHRCMDCGIRMPIDPMRKTEQEKFFEKVYSSSSR